MFSVIQGVVVYPDHHRIYVPAPKESRNSSSTVFSTWPVSSYCCRFTLLESTSYALWIFANLSGSPPLSGCSRVIKFLYARRIYTHTHVHTHTHYRFLSQFPPPHLLLSSFLVSSRIILTSTSLAPLSTPSTAYKSLSAAISLSLSLFSSDASLRALPPSVLLSVTSSSSSSLPPFLLLIPVTTQP